MQFDYKLVTLCKANFMKKLILLIIILFIGHRLFAFTRSVDSVARQTVTTQLPTNIDTLKRLISTTSNDTLKSLLYTQLATQYLNYDKLDSRTKRNFQAQALYYTYEALHLYSRRNDSVGLRTSFDDLTKVYRSQHNFIQAKWFAVQSNSVSRGLKDTPNILASLVVLANIKMDIKDYSLALHDLNEALKLSKANHLPKDEAKIQDNYVLLYNRLKNYDKADVAAKRRDFINDSLLKGEQQLVAKTQDSLQVKKKVPASSKKSSKSSSVRRIASL